MAQVAATGRRRGTPFGVYCAGMSDINPFVPSVAVSLAATPCKSAEAAYVGRHLSKRIRAGDRHVLISSLAGSEFVL